MTRKTDLYGWYRERGETTQNCDYAPCGTGRGSAHFCNSLGRTAIRTLITHTGRLPFVKNFRAYLPPSPFGPLIGPPGLPGSTRACGPSGYQINIEPIPTGLRQ